MPCVQPCAARSPRLGASDQRAELDLVLGGRDYRLLVHTMAPTLGRRYRIAAAVPIVELSADLQVLLERAALAAAVAVGLAVVGALLAALLLSRSLSRIAGKTERIRRLDFSDRVPVVSRITEIARLSDSVERMREGLEVFGRYVSKDLVHQIMRSPETAGVGGTRREITVMFTDIEGFSLLSETMEPELLTSRLSRYFDVLGSAISANHGMIDKYIGDSIMAFWNAPEPDPDHIANACRAALQAAVAGNRLSVKWRGRGRSGFRTRFGLHTGLAVVGNVGARERINYTLVGAVANQASRLEGMNKVYGTEILASGEVAGRDRRPLRVAPHRPHRGGRHHRAARHPRAVGRDRQRPASCRVPGPMGGRPRRLWRGPLRGCPRLLPRHPVAQARRSARAASSSSAARRSCGMARPRAGTASGISTGNNTSQGRFMSCGPMTLDSNLLCRITEEAASVKPGVIPSAARDLWSALAIGPSLRSG